MDIDVGSTQPPSTNRPAHNGRLGPRRAHPFLSPLRHLPALLWKSTFWLHLWSSTPRLHHPAPNSFPHVSSCKRIHLLSYSRPYFRSSLLPTFLPLILDINIPKVSVGAGVLSTAISDDKLSWHRGTNGRHARICIDESGDCVVHV